MSVYTVANINLELKNIESEYIFECMEKYTAQNISDVDICISYRRNDNIQLPKGRIIKGAHRWNWVETENKYTAFQRMLEHNKDVSLLESDLEWKQVNLQLSEFENDLGITNEKRFFTCIGEVFANAVLYHNGFILHSSAIEYDGKGILFSAPSGVGKSTHTGLWKKHYENVSIINDDTPAIRFIGGKPFVFGTPWSGKTRINDNICAPLHAIVFINKATENSITPCVGTEAISLMLSEVRKSVFPEMMEKTLGFIDNIINTVPIYCLSCNISKEAVDLVKNTII
ncbi:MAG: hypothetical protein GX800_00255 [Clostridiaceae bacterium]|nr:hypothetical protein [Clostridiaceae bacterium]